MYRCKWFELYEIIPSYEYNKVVSNEIHPDLYWRKFDDRSLIMLDKLREYIMDKHGSTCYINNYKWGGNIEYAGARPDNCLIGAEFSTHKDWNTFDLKVTEWEGLSYIIKKHLYKSLWSYIYNNPNQFKNINVLESYEHAVTWIHFSTANYRVDENIRIIKPKE